jgi:hypothetical protein
VKLTTPAVLPELKERSRDFYNKLRSNEGEVVVTWCTVGPLKRISQKWDYHPEGGLSPRKGPSASTDLKLVHLEPSRKGQPLDSRHTVQKRLQKGTISHTHRTTPIFFCQLAALL